jgi:hypothetical protein
MYVSAGATEEQLRDKIAQAHNLERDDIQIKDRKGAICLHLDGSTINSKVLYTVEVRSLESMMLQSKKKAMQETKAMQDSSSDSDVLKETLFVNKEKPKENIQVSSLHISYLTTTATNSSKDKAPSG